jgi:hypothetical protein
MRERGEHRLERAEVLRPVVDQQDPKRNGVRLGGDRVCLWVS